MNGIIVQIFVGAALLTVAALVYISVVIGKADRR